MVSDESLLDTVVHFKKKIYKKYFSIFQKLFPILHLNALQQTFIKCQKIVAKTVPCVQPDIKQQRQQQHNPTVHMNMTMYIHTTLSLYIWLKAHKM